MDIQKATKLKVGDIVRFPADRGEPSGSGKIAHISTDVNKNIHGIDYVWVTVNVGQHNTVWPSNRLS